MSGSLLFRDAAAVNSKNPLTKILVFQHMRFKEPGPPIHSACQSKSRQHSIEDPDCGSLPRERAVFGRLLCQAVSLRWTAPLGSIFRLACISWCAKHLDGRFG